jgi:hypothetical protein
MNPTSVYSFALALSLVFTGLSAVAVHDGPNQAGAMRDFDAIESDVSAIERELVAGLLSAYIDGFAIVGEGHPSVQRWRSRLVFKTDPVALAQGVDPRVVHDSLSRVTDDPESVVVDLLLEVWQRLDDETEAARMPAEPVYRNVPPPDGALVRSGVDPSVIDDPALRAQYERAIRENQYRAAELRTTLALRRAYSEYITRASEVLREAGLRMSQEGREQLTARIRDSGLNGAQSLLNSLQSP